MDFSGKIIKKEKDNSSTVEKVKIVSMQTINPPTPNNFSSFDEYDLNFNDLIEEDMIVECEDSEIETPVIPETNKIVLSDELLIEEVRSRTSLWDMQDPRYKNKLVKMTEWEKIVNELNIPQYLHLGFLKENLQKTRKRWDYLRTSFKKAKTPVASGSATTAKKEFRFLKAMSFSDDKGETRPTRGIGLFEDSTDVVSSQQNSDSSNCTFSTPMKFGRKASKKEQFQKEFLEIIKNRSAPIQPQPVPVVAAAPTPTPETLAQKGFMDMMGAYMAILPGNKQTELRLKLLTIVQTEVDEYEKK